MVALTVCCPTVYHLFQLQKLKCELQEWGFLTEEERKQKEHHTNWSLFWGALYILSLLGVIIATVYD